MNEVTFPIQSKATLIKASLIAFVLAMVVFITIILPAEYNIDPTGLGKLMGLTVFSSEALTESSTLVIETKRPEHQENEVTIVVPANQGVEYKFKVHQYGHLTYEWTTDAGVLFFDFHGEPKGDTTGYFESYTIATAKKMKGSMTFPFDGVHGWYWKNNSDQPIKVTLKTKGNYEIVGLIH